MYTISAVSTDIISNEGILDLFRNASWENLLFFVLFSVVIVFGVNRITKPQKEQNRILGEFANSIMALVKNNAVEEKSRDERHERYLYEINDIRERINVGFARVDLDLEKLNDAFIRHTATRCGGEQKTVKEVTLNEVDER